MVNKNKNTPRLVIIKAKKGDSMTPLITLEARISLDTRPEQHYKAGDIVAYIGYGGRITLHRIIFSTVTVSGKRYYILKGDHNRRADRYIDEQYVFGRAQKIIYPSYDIDLTTPLSSCTAKVITHCGRVTILYHRFYVLERIVTICLIKTLILFARSSSLLCGKIPCGGDTR